MAHTSFLFVAITAGYFITLTLLLDRVKRMQWFTYGLVAYASTIAMVVVATIGHSIAIEAHNIGPHVEIWIGGLSWIACGLSAILLLLTFLPPVNLGDAKL